MTKHNHHDHCEHEEVACCGRCQVVYCKGCQREWGANSTYIPYSTTTASAPLTDDPSWVTFTACSHA